MEIIYQPKGKALEYAELALNYYVTCEHACKYCYSPQTLHKPKEDFFQPGLLKHDILSRLEKDCKELAQLKKCPEILISFIGDPYQPAELKYGMTRQVIEVLIAYNLPFTILTKGGTRAIRDFDYLEKYDKARFGTTLISTVQEFTDEWEPHAPSAANRIEAIQEAKKRGIKTWVSLEPVIEPNDAMQIIARLYKIVDFWAIGKLNYWPELEKKFNWKEFHDKAKELLDVVKADYYFKKSLTEL